MTEPTPHNTLPRMSQEVFQSNTLLIFFIAALHLCLYVVASEGDLTLILASTLLGPLWTLPWFSFKPFNPYRNAFEPEHPYSEECGITKNVVTFFSSDFASRKLKRLCYAVGVTQCVVGLTVSFLRGTLTLSHPEPYTADVVVMVLSLALFSGGVATIFWCRWGFETIGLTESGVPAKPTV